MDTQLEYQLEIGIAHKINSPKHFTAADQTSDTSAAPNKANNSSSFDNLKVRKYFVNRWRQKIPKNSVNAIYNTKKYLNQYRVLKLFYKEYVGEPLLRPFVTYTDMKNFILFILSI